MIDRRKFLAAASLAAAAAGSRWSMAETRKPLSILILGGTRFIGVEMTELALKRGHKVTFFNRGKTNADLERQQSEFIVLLKGYDDTFNQMVHSRYSYRYDDIVWGRRFAPAFHLNADGDFILEVDKVGDLMPGQT